MSPTTTSLPTGTCTVDPQTSSATITATKLGFFTVPATLEVRDGTVVVADGEVVGVDATVAAGTYTSQNPKRNDHIRSADFLDAENHPDISFSAERAEAVSSGHRVNGQLTVKGVASPVAFEVSDLTVEGDRASFEVTAGVDRSAIGVDKLPSFVIGNHLKVSARIEATRTPS